MTYQNKCVVCGKEFETSKFEMICSECGQTDQKVFNVIRDYLYAHPGANVNEVTKETGISASKILKYLKEGRIETVGNVTLLNCEVCGKAIRYGTLCEACQQSENRSFTSSSGRKTSGSKKTMHTKIKKR